ncbi:unnamed protein product [Auanema sp. JU1783]|nr:unnamed protein product [Auanema sp. JU1783]
MRVGYSQKWKFLMITCCITYAVFVYFPNLPSDKSPNAERNKFRNKVIKPNNVINMDLKEQQDEPEVLSAEKQLLEEKQYFEFKPVEGESFFVQELMTNYDISLAEKLTCKADQTAPPKLIVSINAGHDQSNLEGCPEWNCVLSRDRSKADEADALLLIAKSNEKYRKSDQYYIYFSQESPKNSATQTHVDNFYNMTLGYRHDSPTSSPYGYTVKLAPQSRKLGQLIDSVRVNKKFKGAAWFVSHCSTNSRREQIIGSLKKHFPVDVYGACGNLRCPRGASCEDALDNEYHFYVAVENSICKDYLTEKLWNQGYGRDVVPIVLSRKLTEPFVPPNSFIAVDDFKTTEELATHLKYLMSNKTAYMEYFDWRRDYKVVFLDGKNHDALEKPWGFCQICRLLWEKPRKQYTIPNFTEYWTKSCEEDGTLARGILGDS